MFPMMNRVEGRAGRRSLGRARDRSSTSCRGLALAVNRSTARGRWRSVTWRAARIQRRIAVLGNLKLASGVALVAVNAVLAQ
jgi:hypothetical protein